jgi:vacuolar-type H+-ATPase subunit E/Vma4
VQKDQELTRKRIKLEVNTEYRKKIFRLRNRMPLILDDTYKEELEHLKEEVLFYKTQAELKNNAIIKTMLMNINQEILINEARAKFRKDSQGVLVLSDVL